MKKRTKDTVLPPLTQQPILNVDCTPDDGYPMRILEAHRQHCECNWEVHGLDKAATLVYQMMNKDNAKRYAILTQAIEALRRTRPRGRMGRETQGEQNVQSRQRAQ